MSKTLKGILVTGGIIISSFATMFLKSVKENDTAKEKHDKLVKESAEEAAKLVMAQLTTKD